MKLPFRHAAAIGFAALSATAPAEELKPPPPLPPSGGPTTVYRQVTPDGRIVYSDKVVKGAKVDQTMTIEEPAKGDMWSAESGTRPKIAPQEERTPVTKVPTVPGSKKRKTVDDAEADVIRAEMLLEDARKRRDAGVEPLPGERTGNADGKTSRLNETYMMRQQQLARDVDEAAAMLKKSAAERDALRRTR